MTRRPPPAATPDDELVAAARGGDDAALEELLRRAHPRMFAVCRRILGGDQADALDATQEALIAVVRGLPAFDGRSAFSTWTYRVATNTCLDELRRRRRRPQLAAVEPEERAAPGDHAGAVDDRLALQGALGQLPEDYRVAVVLRDVADLDYAEIAAVLGIPGGTVRSRIARGRSALAALLGNPAGAGSVGDEGHG